MDEIVARKKLKQNYEYEVSCKNMSSTKNIWLPSDRLIQHHFEKVCHHLIFMVTWY